MVEMNSHVYRSYFKEFISVVVVLRDRIRCDFYFSVTNCRSHGWDRDEECAQPVTVTLKKEIETKNTECPCSSGLRVAILRIRINRSLASIHQLYRPSPL